MAQIARNLTDAVNGYLLGKRYLLVDRDSKFTDQFCESLADSGTKIIRTAVRAHNMNAFAERWVRSIKTECLSKMIFFGPAILDRAIRDYVEHYNQERPHQGIGNRLVIGPQPRSTGEIIERERLGGLLRIYTREVA